MHVVGDAEGIADYKSFPIKMLPESPNQSHLARRMHGFDLLRFVVLFCSNHETIGTLDDSATAMRDARAY